MVPEEEVAATIATLPESCFLRQYVKWASVNTDAPMLYHAAMGVTLLGSVAPIDHRMSFAGWQYGLVWSLLIGRSGRTRKSTAMKLARGILTEVNSDLVGDRPDSKEGLLESLAISPQQTLFYLEYGNFLAETKKGRLESLKTAITELWDNDPYQRRLSRGVTYIDTPRLTVCGGVANGMLERHTTPSDWDTGDMARYFAAHARRERTYKNPGGYSQIRVWLVKVLAIISQKEPGFCLGFDEAAQAHWDNWCSGLVENWESKAPESMIGAIERADTLAIKVALAISLDLIALNGGEWRIPLEALRVATTYAEWHLASIFYIGENLATTLYQQQRRQVLHRIGETATSHQQIAAAVRMAPRTLAQVLEGLLAEGVIHRWGGVSATGANNGSASWYSTSPFVLENTPDNVVSLNGARLDQAPADSSSSSSEGGPRSTGASDSSTTGNGGSSEGT